MLHGTDLLTIQGHFLPMAGRIKDYNTHIKQPIIYHFSQNCHRHFEFNMPPNSAPRLVFISWLYYWHHNTSTKAQKLETWCYSQILFFLILQVQFAHFCFPKLSNFRFFPASLPLPPWFRPSKSLTCMRLLIDLSASMPLVPQWLIFILPPKWAL